MKTLELILWVTQFGFSLLVPPCLLLMLAHWLQGKFGFGLWCPLVLGFLGLLISFSTARANWKAMRKTAESGSKQPPVSFNDHQ